MRVDKPVVAKIIEKLIKGQDYRIEVVTLINAEFLQFAIDFFKKVVEAKLESKGINEDWYKKIMLDSSLDKNEIAINSGLNMKTIGNMFNSTKKEIVIDASINHYDSLYKSISELAEQSNDIDLTLVIRINGVSVELNINESLIVINTLAVKRAALRGGLWSMAGKRVEGPLMEFLCGIYGVKPSNYSKDFKKNKDELFDREIDFYLIDDQSLKHKCEVKLMGKGNPESADAVIARDSDVFIADKLSYQNKNQLDSLGVRWVELRSENGFEKFSKVLDSLGIKHDDLNNLQLKERIDLLLDKYKRT